MESIVAGPKADRPGLNPYSAVSCSKVYWVMGGMERYALVIGIGSYGAMVALSKPAGDAIAVEQVLTRAGWRVTCLSDRITFEAH
jgi:hypothetical protein